MKLTMKQLVNQLRLFDPQGDINEADSTLLSSVCIFTKNMKYNFNDVLLIGYASDLRDCSMGGQVTIVCIEDMPVPQEYQSQKNILRLSANTDINEVYHVILSLLKEDEAEKEFMERLCQSVLHEEDICKICNLAKEYIKNPIVVLDNSLKHIAESSGTELQDAIWVDQRKNGSYMSADYVQLLAEQAGYKKDHYSIAPVLLPKGKLKCRRIISHILLNNHPIGTIVIFEVEKIFEELDLKLAKRLAEFLALHMRNNDSLLYARGVVYEHLFKDLLDERIAPAECLHEFLIQERNIAHTALALHMHRNTLIYRINRIQEIMNHDLDDHDFRFRLLLSFRLLEFTKY